MSFPKPEIIGKSKVIKKVIEMTEKLGNFDLNVLITGESGVGKELVARSLHYYSNNRASPFIKVNSAALPFELLESELFGYEKGAFTGAEKSKSGKFELAQDGTIFLDEIGELPLNMQSKLLQVLQDRKFHRVGGQKEVNVSARVIAATNQNLEQAILAGNFREDLFFRLSTISIHIPPLRERKEDIQPLLEYFVEKFSYQHNNVPIKISPNLMDLFIQYHWPGNVREMENYLHRLSVLGNYQELEKEILSNIRRKETGSSESASENNTLELSEEEMDWSGYANEYPSLKEVRDQAVKKVEKMVIEKVLRDTNWNRKETSRRLKISYRALLYKMKAMDIHPPYK